MLVKWNSLIHFSEITLNASGDYIWGICTYTSNVILTDYRATRYLLFKKAHQGLFVFHPRYLQNLPSTSRLTRNNHTKTHYYYFYRIPCFQQYCLFNREPQPQRGLYVNKRSLIPTLPWLCYNNFTNPLNIPAKESDKEDLHATFIYQLTCPGNFDDLPKINVSRVLNRRIARKSKQLPITRISMFTDLNVIRATFMWTNGLVSCPFRW